jgi:hypothetical protein
VFEVMTGDVIWFFLFYSESKLMNLWDRNSLKLWNGKLKVTSFTDTNEL